MLSKLLACLLLVTLGTSLGLAQNKTSAAKEEWIQLFNGKDLSGWHPKIRGYALNENFGNTFRVENGVMKVAYDQYSAFDNKFGHIFYKDPFSYYRIAVEYRFVGEQAPGGPNWALKNSGIMIHCLDPKTMGKDQDFPISIEVQLLGGPDTGERPTANLCTPGTNVERDGKLFTTHCLNSTSKTYRGDQWVRAEVLVLGDERIEHYVNWWGQRQRSRPGGEGRRPAAHRRVYLPAK
jgi:hypothetical protein